MPSKSQLDSHTYITPASAGVEAYNPVDPASVKPRPPRRMLIEIEGRITSGAGPGVPLQFLKRNFGAAQDVIRIASAYFTLSGYKLGRRHTAPGVTFRILVGKEDGRNVVRTVLEDIRDDLGSCETDLWETVARLVEQIRNGQFQIVDARAMETPFHCKFYICDNTVLFQGSANFSWTGLQRSAENIGESRHPIEVAEFRAWFDETASLARDLLADLLALLEAWLQLAHPFDIYLKTLLLLNNLPPQSPRAGGHEPAYFQKGVIARALRQAETYGGGLVVAATGLGKTIIGAEIAWRLQQSRQIKRTLLVAPGGVREAWERELRARDVNFEPYNTAVLFRQTTVRGRNQPDRLEARLATDDRETVILIDEAHFYRNQLLARKTRGQSLVFERLGPVAERGARIFLLTATPYGTNMQNLDSLLYLLPHGAPGLTAGMPWEANSADEFSRLPVVTVLGLAHVVRMARERGDVDENGRPFIRLPGEQRYLPRLLRLHSVRYRLWDQEAMRAAMDHGCCSQAEKFRQAYYDDLTAVTKTGAVDTVYNNTLLSWLGSPLALAASLAANLRTPGQSDEVPDGASGPGDVSSRTDLFGQPSRAVRKQKRRDPPPDLGGYAPWMSLNLAERQQKLAPILAGLERADYGRDDKFQKLLAILRQHCVDAGEKVIVFVRRHLTAQYLAQGLEANLPRDVRIACTVGEDEEGEPGLLPARDRAEILRRFSPKSHGFEPDQNYRVLICTDADGVGVNLQDADTVVNYDPPQGADTLVQRAGRVLRMTTDANRAVSFYTFLPELAAEGDSVSECQRAISDAFERITRRHSSARDILGAEVLARKAYVEASLDTDDVDVESLLLRDEGVLAEIGGLGAEAMMDHTAVLEQHRKRAEALPDYLLSARHGPDGQHRVFVLLRVEGESGCHAAVYDLSMRALRPMTDLEVLDLLRCDVETPPTGTSPGRIERAGNVAARTWCKQHGRDLGKVRRICTLYLEPKYSPLGLDGLLNELEASLGVTA